MCSILVTQVPQPRGREALRARIVEATALVVCERGYGDTTVTFVCARANLSRGTFYEAFDCLRECFLAIVDDGYMRARALIEQSFEEHRYWLDGVRGALASVLALLDDEPLLARMWVVETLAAGTWALERREHNVAALTSMIVEQWIGAEEPQLSPLFATGAMESVLGVLRIRLLSKSREPLLALLAPLMGLIATIYLGAQAATAEVERCETLIREMLAERDAQARRESSAEVEIPEGLHDRRAHRARGCLLYLAEHQGASNRQVARAVGISRDDQISTMLARLARMELLVKCQGPPGGPNAWSLSPYGLRVAQALGGTAESSERRGGREHRA